MKVRVTEVRGTSHVLTEKGGKTFRLLSYQSVDVDDSILSEDFYNEQRSGGILISAAGSEGRTKKVPLKKAKEDNASV